MEKKTNYKRLEFGGGIVMFAVSLLLPLLYPIVIPVSITILCIGVLLMISSFSKESFLKSFVIPSVIVTFCAASLFIYHTYSKPNFATPDELIASHLIKKDIRINDLTREESVIRNKTFDDCHIYGPALIMLKSCLYEKIAFTEFGDDPNAIFVETTTNPVSGAIVFDTCVMKNCTFHKIGFLGSSESLNRAKETFKLKKSEQ
jgi:hypothetical protein